MPVRGTKAAAPDPRLMGALLPAGARLQHDRQAGLVWFIDPSAGSARWHPGYLAHLSPARAAAVQKDRPCELIAAFDADESPLIANFTVILEATVVTARIEGRRLAVSRGSHADFVSVLPDLQLIGSRLAQGLFHTRVPPRGLTADGFSALNQLVEAVGARLRIAATISFLLNAYGTGRAQYSSEESDRWPVQAPSHLLSLEQHSAFEVYRRKPDYVIRTLAAAGRPTIAGYEDARWSLLRSFFWDSREAFAAQIPANRLPVEQQWSQIPSINTIVDALAELAFYGVEHQVPASDQPRAVRQRAAILDDFATHWQRPDFALPQATPSEVERPAPHPYGVSPRGAEFLCRDWMRFFGIADAEVTRSHADGGIDVTSSTYVAQVKHYTGSVGAPEVQQLVGVAHTTRRDALFFTSGKYTPAAMAAAEAVGMPLLRYSAEDGTIEGANAAGIAIATFGVAR